jgi:hypothetical protein
MTSLAQQLFLIAFDSDRGKATANPQLALPYGLAGAVLLEGGADPGPDVKRQVKKLAGRRENVQGRVTAELVARGVLEERDAKVLGFKVRRYTLRDTAERDQVVARVREVLLGSPPPDSQTTELVALCGACGLVDRLVEKDQRKTARQRAKAMTSGDATGKAVSSAVQEVEAAVMAGVIAAVAASSVTSSGHGH